MTLVSANLRADAGFRIYFALDPTAAAQTFQMTDRARKAETPVH